MRFWTKPAHGGGPLDPEAAGLAADIKAMTADGELDGWNTDVAISKPRPPVDLSPGKFYGTKPGRPSYAPSSSATSAAHRGRRLR